ncbi:MAG: hypothetical protein AAFW75_25990 [Cyanobacteria bacterium J06636_16]
MTHISDRFKPDKRQLEETFNQIKTEGSIRSSRIAQILRSAFAESLGELKAGAITVTPTTKDAKESATQLIRETSEEVAARARKAWTDGTLVEGWRDWLLAEIQTAANAIDATLSEKKRSARVPNEVVEPSKLNSASDGNI